MSVSRLILLVAATASLGATVGCSEVAGPERELSGERLYETHCARCHGPDGKGTAAVPGAKDLSNTAYMESLTDERIRATIKRGKPPNMPSFGEQFMEPSMKVLVAYVRSLSKPDVAEATQPGGAGPGDSPANESE